MTGWILYDTEQYEKNNWFAHELLASCRKFCDMQLILVQELHFGITDGEIHFSYKGKTLPAPKFAVVRTIYPLLSKTLQEAGVRLFNPYPIHELCNDKRKTHLTVRKSGINMMNTLFFDKRFFDIQSIEKSLFPCVLKSAAGHGGREVFLIKDKTELSAKLRTLPRDDFLLQELCIPYGRDLRVYILGGEILSSVLRSSEEFRSNFSLGGKVSLYKLNAEQKEIVERILSVLPCTPDFIGIDFLMRDNDMIFNEIEDVVGTRMLYATSDINVIEELAEYIKSHICPV